MNEKTKRLLLDKRIFIFLIAIGGIALILISSTVKTSNEKASGYDNSYGEYLENKLKSTLSSIDGVGSIDVMITFENSYEALSVDNSGDFYFRSSGEAEVIEKPLPTIAGVMIVCRDITSTEDFKAIKKATSTVLGINESKINIIGGNRP